MTNRLKQPYTFVQSAGLSPSAVALFKYARFRNKIQTYTQTRS